MLGRKQPACSLRATADNKVPVAAEGLPQDIIITHACMHAFILLPTSGPTPRLPSLPPLSLVTKQPIFDARMRWVTEVALRL